MQSSSTNFHYNNIQNSPEYQTIISNIHQLNPKDIANFLSNYIAIVNNEVFLKQNNNILTPHCQLNQFFLSMELTKLFPHLSKSKINQIKNYLINHRIDSTLDHQFLDYYIHKGILIKGISPNPVKWNYGYSIEKLLNTNFSNSKGKSAVDCHYNILSHNNQHIYDILINLKAIAFINSSHQQPIFKQKLAMIGNYHNCKSYELWLNKDTFNSSFLPNFNKQSNASDFHANKNLKLNHYQKFMFLMNWDNISIAKLNSKKFNQLNAGIQLSSNKYINDPNILNLNANYKYDDILDNKLKLFNFNSAYEFFLSLESLDASNYLMSLIIKSLIRLNQNNNILTNASNYKSIIESSFQTNNS